MLEPLAQYPEVVASYGRQVIVHADGREDWDASWQTMEDYGKGRNVHAGWSCAGCFHGRSDEVFSE